MSTKVVRALRFPESSFLGLRTSFSRSSFSRHPRHSIFRSKRVQVSGLSQLKSQLKCLPASLAQLKKELYNSPLSLEEKLILHMLSNTRQVHASLHPKRANNVKTSCKNIVYYVFLRGFWTNFNSTVLSKNFS